MERAERLTAGLSKLPIVRAYLFGSQARGDSGPLSDVDVAILPAAQVQPRERADLAERVATLAAHIYGVPRGDAVLLDDAPPALAFAAIGGILILDNDAAGRTEFEARIASTFHDRLYYESRWERETLQRYARGEFA